MKVMHKVARGISLVVWFILVWIVSIFITLPYDLVRDVLIHRYSVKEVFTEYIRIWKYNSHLFVQDWKSLFEY